MIPIPLLYTIIILVYYNHYEHIITIIGIITIIIYHQADNFRGYVPNRVASEDPGIARDIAGMFIPNE